jgi:hypothetical protein
MSRETDHSHLDSPLPPKFKVLLQSEYIDFEDFQRMPLFRNTSTSILWDLMKSTVEALMVE